MKFKYLTMPAIVLLSSCSWMGEQTHDFMQWADRTMPTYDGSHLGVEKPSAPSKLIVEDYPNGSTGLTSAQVSSAKEGGNSRPTAAVPNYNPNYNSGGYNSVPRSAAPAIPPGMVPSAPPAAIPVSNSTGRRAPSGQLPPSAIQPAPYGQLHAPAGMTPPPTVPGAKDDFPSEYKNSGRPANDPGFDSMIPPPPPM